MAGSSLTLLAAVLLCVCATAAGSKPETKPDRPKTRNWLQCEARFYKDGNLKGDSFVLTTGNVTEKIWDGQAPMYWAVADIASKTLVTAPNVWMDDCPSANTTAASLLFKKSIRSFEFRCLSNYDTAWNRANIELEVYNMPLAAYRRRSGEVDPNWQALTYKLEDYAPALAMATRNSLPKDWQKVIASAVITFNWEGWTPSDYVKPSKPSKPSKPVKHHRKSLA